MSRGTLRLSRSALFLEDRSGSKKLHIGIAYHMAVVLGDAFVGDDRIRIIEAPDMEKGAFSEFRGIDGHNYFICDLPEELKRLAFHDVSDIKATGVQTGNTQIGLIYAQICERFLTPFSAKRHITIAVAQIPSGDENIHILIFAQYNRCIDVAGYDFDMRIGRSPVPNVYKGDESFEIGKAYKLRAGDDITLIACGRMVYPAIKAAERLEQAGIHTRVLDMFTIKPLDEEAIIAAARETKGIITIEEHVQTGGLGEAVGAVLCCKAPAPMRILALPDEHLICGSDQEILDHYGLNVEGIICAANKFIQGN